MEGNEKTLSKVRQAKNANLATIMSKPNVVGVGTGYRQRRGELTDELCVLALVERKVPRVALKGHELVPAEVDSVPTDVVQVGRLTAFQSRTDRWRPAPGGVSIGHFQITAGTLGAPVRDRSTGAKLILSNNHVLANMNDAHLGDPVVQPGTLDGGREGVDTIGVLERFQPIDFGSAPSTCSLADGVAAIANWLARLIGSRHRLQAFQENTQARNLIDAAVARPIDEAWVADEILEIGALEGTLPAALGMRVRKSGRTTGLTSGEVRVLDATVTIDYGGRSALFEDQILTGPMSEPGDSGSVLVASDSQDAVGLLFAGSQQSTVFNPIGRVLELLDVMIG
jgi:hypothetical protein